MAANAVNGMTLTGELMDHETKPFPRILVAATLSGGTAADDSAVEILAGDYKLCMLENHNTDEAILGYDLKPVNGFIPPNTKIVIKCVDAFAADCHIGLLIQPARRSVSY